jgi:putative protein kinase ArgK-like GTPase of G3E family
MAKAPTDTFESAILNLAKRVDALLLRQQASEPPSRTLVALAGVPGSGKSTVSAALLVELAARGITDVAVVPMVRKPPGYPSFFTLAQGTALQTIRPLQMHA